MHDPEMNTSLDKSPVKDLDQLEKNFNIIWLLDEMKIY